MGGPRFWFPPVRPSDKAWAVLAAGVVVYDLACPEFETMSDACDRYMLRRPWLVRTIAFLVAAHVGNALPARYDPIHLMFAGIRRLTR